MNEKSEQHLYSIEKWTIHPDQNLISSGSEQIAVEPKTMSVLVFLIEKQGQTISREEFINEVWGGSIVTENSLNQSISKLRKIFNDEAVQPRIVETVSKKGYRLIVPVKRLDDPTLHRSKIAASLLSLRALALSGILLVVLALTYWGLSGTSSEKTADAVILSAEDGMERQPEVSHSGEQVAYVFGNICTEESEIRIRNLMTNETKRYALIPGIKKFPRFSLDDSSLVYWNSTIDDSKSTLYRISHNDTAATVLLEIDCGVRGLSWSHNGRFFVYSANVDRNSTFCIYLFDSQTGQVILLTRPVQNTSSDFFPVFSPDDRSVVFSRRNDRFESDLWKVDLETHELKRVTSDKVHILGLDWSTEGIVYSRLSDADVFEIVKLDPITYEKTIVLASREHISHLNSSHRRVYFQSNFEAISVVSYNLENGMRSALFNSNFQEVFPYYSPDGKYFSFISNRTGPFLLWVGDIDGAQTKIASNRRLSNTCSQPRWTSDGKSVIFDLYEGGKWTIYISNVDNGNTQVLIEDASHPVVSLDGRYVYFNSHRSGSSQIWKTLIDREDPVPVTTHGGFIGYESPLDASFYFMKQDEPGIWKKNDAGDELVIPDIPAFLNENWTLKNDKIIYAYNYALWQFDIRSKTISLVTSVREGTCGNLYGLSLSPDGKTLLYSRDERVESDLKILEY